MKVAIKQRKEIWVREEFRKQGITGLDNDYWVGKIESRYNKKYVIGIKKGVNIQSSFLLPDDDALFDYKNMEQKELFKVRDLRKKDQFKIDDKYLNGYAKIFGVATTAVYNSLCRHAEFHTQECFPSEEQIAEEHNISVWTVRRAIKKLKLANIIRIEREKTSKGKWLNNIYFLIDKSEWANPESIEALWTNPESKNNQNQRAKTIEHQCSIKDNKGKDTNITSSKEEGKTPSSYGNEDINYLIDFLKEKTGLTKLDCSIKQNRRYCWLALKKFGGRQKVEAIIKMALRSDFHRKNLTSMKYIYYNGVKIVSEFKEEIENPRFISIGKKI